MRNFNLCSSEKHQHIKKSFVLFYFLEHPSSIFPIYRLIPWSAKSGTISCLSKNSNPPRKQINKQKTWNVSGPEIRLLSFRLIFDLCYRWATQLARSQLCYELYKHKHKPRVPAWVDQLLVKSHEAPAGWEAQRGKVHWKKEKVR